MPHIRPNRLLTCLLFFALCVTSFAQLNTWMFKAHMHVPRNQFAAATAPDGRIFAIGGANAQTPSSLDTAEAYDPQTDSWSDVASMPKARQGHAAVAGPDGRLYVIGGETYFNNTPDPTTNTSVIVYDPLTNIWSTVADLPQPMPFPEATLGADGKIYAFEGENQSIQSCVYSYDSQTNTWTQVTSAPTDPFVARGIVTDGSGKILLVNGFGWNGINGYSDTVKCLSFDPHTGVWIPRKDSPIFRSGPQLLRGRNDLIYAAGGLGGSGAVKDVSNYIPGSDFWFTGPSLKIARALAASARGIDGTIYVLGGSDGVSPAVDSMEAMLTSNIKAAIFSAFEATEGQSFSGTVVDIRVGDPTVPTSELSATVDWGDGTGTLNGTTVKLAGDKWTVIGPHTYAHAGHYFVNVSIKEQGVFVTGGGYSVDVQDAPLTGDVVDITAEAGTKFTGTIAGFTDANPQSDATYFNANMTWGDGTTSSGQVFPDGNGGYIVNSEKTYAASGVFPVTVQVTEPEGTNDVSWHGFASVTNASAKVQANDITATEGTKFTGVVGTFTHSNANLTAANFVGSINWGDGSAVTVGAISANGAGFNVSGSHTYMHAGSYSVTITVALSGAANSMAIGDATVADAPLTATGFNLTCKGTKFGDTVATFTDSNPYGVVSEYSAAIFWGDGKSSTGSVVKVGAGYKVVGSHTYLKKGKFTVTVTIGDTGGSTASATTHINVGPVK